MPANVNGIQAMNLEVLGSLILQELRLFRNDTKEELRRLRKDIRCLHDKPEWDDPKLSQNLSCLGSESNPVAKQCDGVYGSSDSAEYAEKTAMTEEQSPASSIFNPKLSRPVSESNSASEQYENVFRQQISDDVESNRNSTIEQTYDTSPKCKSISKVSKQSLTDIVDMLKNKNIAIKHEVSTSDDLELQYCWSTHESMSNSFHESYEDSAKVEKNEEAASGNENEEFGTGAQSGSPHCLTSDPSFDLMVTRVQHLPTEAHVVEASNGDALNQSFEKLDESWGGTELNQNREDHLPRDSISDETVENGDAAPENGGSNNTSLDFSEATTNFKCQYCKKPFRHYSSYKSHLRTHTGEKPFVCDLCNKTFSQKGNLKTHMLFHSNEKPFSCDFCSKRFVQKSTLTSHLRTHTGEKPFVCNFCGKRFAHKGNLTQHEMLHRNVRPHVCHYCDKRFLQKCTLSAHLRSHTGEKPFSCYCGKAFARKTYLMQHMRLHDKTTRFPCPLCSKTFSQRANLNAHMVRHTNNEVYHCDICNKSFKKHASLLAHKQIHFM